MEWVQIVSEYGALGVLTILMILFARGQVVSKKTLEENSKQHKESLDSVKTSFEKTVSILCKSHEDQIKTMTTAFTKQIRSLKEVIKIMKKTNGIK